MHRAVVDGAGVDAAAHGGRDATCRHRVRGGHLAGVAVHDGQLGVGVRVDGTQHSVEVHQNLAAGVVQVGDGGGRFRVGSKRYLGRLLGREIEPEDLADRCGADVERVVDRVVRRGPGVLHVLVVGDAAEVGETVAGLEGPSVRVGIGAAVDRPVIRDRQAVQIGRLRRRPAEVRHLPGGGIPLEQAPLVEGADVDLAVRCDCDRRVTGGAGHRVPRELGGRLGVAGGGDVQLCVLTHGRGVRGQATVREMPEGALDHGERAHRRTEVVDPAAGRRRWDVGGRQGTVLRIVVGRCRECGQRCGERADRGGGHERAGPGTPDGHGSSKRWFRLGP